MTSHPTDAVLCQIDELIAHYNDATGGDPMHLQWKPSDEMRALRTRLAAGIDRLAPASSSYVRDARQAAGKDLNDWVIAVQLAGILRALRDDYAAGYMTSVEELVHADLFSDFLEMADELVVKGYKDAAAVIAGSVLEEHLRKLALAHGVSIRAGASHKKADTINADLMKAGVYNKLELKQVTAWLGLRNDAAHGNYDNYDKAQVVGLIRDVRDFMIRHPA